MLKYSLFLVLLYVFCRLQHVYSAETTATSINSNLKEGSTCFAKNSTETVNGTCTSLYKCTSAAQAYLNAEAGFDTAWPPIYACSKQDNGDPTVCCLDCHLDEKEALKGLAVMERGHLYPTTPGGKAWLKCIDYYSSLPYLGRKRAALNSAYWRTDNKCVDYSVDHRTNGTYDNGKITYGIGGLDAKYAEFPHMAQLGYGEEREFAQWLCGGSIISERFILTAAHCVAAPKLGNVTFAALGVLKRTDLTDYWRLYTIKDIIIHPEYQPPSKYHDIMLLETSTKINFGKTVLPACLDVGKTSDQVLFATGWGRLSAKGELGNTLQVMQLHKFNESLCSELFPPHRLFAEGYNSTIQMCYEQLHKVVDTCEGDSGGPLQYSLVESYHHVLGITSFGKDCGIAGNAGMYTRVKHYVPWIESIVWADE